MKWFYIFWINLVILNQFKSIWSGPISPGEFLECFGKVKKSNYKQKSLNKWSKNCFIPSSYSQIWSWCDSTPGKERKENRCPFYAVGASSPRQAKFSVRCRSRMGCVPALHLVKVSLCSPLGKAHQPSSPNWQNSPNIIEMFFSSKKLTK